MDTGKLQKLVIFSQFVLSKIKGFLSFFNARRKGQGVDNRMYRCFTSRGLTGLYGYLGCSYDGPIAAMDTPGLGAHILKGYVKPQKPKTLLLSLNHFCITLTRYIFFLFCDLTFFKAATIPVYIGNVYVWHI